MNARDQGAERPSAEGRTAGARALPGPPGGHHVARVSKGRHSSAEQGREPAMTATVTVGTRAPEAWRGFAGTRWRERGEMGVPPAEGWGSVDVRDFIQANYTPYEGDAAFLTGPTDRTRTVWDKVSALLPGGAAPGHPRRRPGDPRRRSPSHAPGLHRPRAGADRRPADRRPAEARDHAERRPADGRAQPEGVRLRARPASSRESSRTYRKTHNDGVFDAYTPEMRAARKAGHHHRTARRLRPRPDHRRLPARRRSTASTG